MTDCRKLDDPLAAPLAHALNSRLDRSGRDCPDAETLALYFDRSLTADETARWELHFSACAHCQQRLAAMVRMETGATPATAPASLPSASDVSWRWTWRWLAPAAAALGALAIWMVVNTTPNSTHEPLIARNTKIATPAVRPAEPAAPGADAQDAVSKELAGRADATGSGESKRTQAPTADPQRSARLDQAFAPKAVGPTAMRSAQIAAPADQTKDPSAALLAKQADTPKVVEEQAQNESRLAAIEGRPASQAMTQAAPPAAPSQQIAHAPQAPPRAREQDLRGARDEAKKTQAEPLAPVAEAVTVEAATDAAAPRREGSDLAGRFKAANAPGSKIVWRLGPAGSIERSSDAGATWQSQASGVEADLLAGSAPSATVCWAVGRGGVVLRTTDGSTWARLGSPSAQDLIAVVAVDANRATVTTADGKRYTTSDAGRSWRSL